MSPDVWGNDPDRTTRRETWGQIEEAAIGLANYRPITVTTAPARKRRDWYGVVGALLLTVSLIGVVACLVIMAQWSDPAPAPHPVESAVWFEPAPETVEVPALWAA